MDRARHSDGGGGGAGSQLCPLSFLSPFSEDEAFVFTGVYFGRRGCLVAVERKYDGDSLIYKADHDSGLRSKVHMMSASRK